MAHQSNISRRDFLQTTSAGLSMIAMRPRVFAANAKLNHACIGVGGMGGGDLRNFISHPQVQIVAICDVDGARLEAARKLVPDARYYSDWRELIDTEGARIDSLNIAVPDHMHAPITMAALQAKKHVYCQKPLCHDVAECRAVAKGAAAARVITQLGTQVASGIGDRMAVQFLREGVMGKVKRVVLCSNRPNAIEMYRLKGPRPPEVEAPPPHLAWDLWIGSAPDRPFAADIYHPKKWRAWQDFGTGWLGDIGCHIFDAVWKGLGLTEPKSVVAEVQKSWEESPERRADTWPQSDHVTWIFPGNKLTQKNELTLEWFDGEMFPPADVREFEGLATYPAESAQVIGTEGTLLLQHNTGPQLFPREKFADLPRPKLPPRNHYHHFVDACLRGEMTESHFVQTAPMTEAILLGTIAIRHPGKLLKWDGPRMRFSNAPEANCLLRRTYRDGWKVAGV